MAKTTNDDLIKKIETFEKRMGSRFNAVARVGVDTKKKVEDLDKKVEDLTQWKSNILYAESLEEKKLNRQISDNPYKVIVFKLLPYIGWLIAIIAALLKVEL